MSWKRPKRGSCSGARGPVVSEDIRIIFSPTARSRLALTNVCKNILSGARQRGLRQRRTRREKWTIFATHSGTCDSESPKHTPKSSRALRSGITDLPCETQKKFACSQIYRESFCNNCWKMPKKWGQLWGRFLRSRQKFGNLYPRMPNGNYSLKTGWTKQIDQRHTFWDRASIVIDPPKLGKSLNIHSIVPRLV